MYKSYGAGGMGLLELGPFGNVILQYRDIVNDGDVLTFTGLYETIGDDNQIIKIF